MQDTTLFEAMLGMAAPWTLSRVTLDMSGERVDLWAEPAADACGPCPE